MGCGGGGLEKKPAEKSKKHLYLCLIATQRNTDEAGRHFTYLAWRSPPLAILATSMGPHLNPYGERSARKTNLLPRALKHF